MPEPDPPHLHKTSTSPTPPIAQADEASSDKPTLSPAQGNPPADGYYGERLAHLDYSLARAHPLDTPGVTFTYETACRRLSNDTGFATHETTNTGGCNLKIAHSQRSIPSNIGRFGLVTYNCNCRYRPEDSVGESEPLDIDYSDLPDLVDVGPAYAEDELSQTKTQTLLLREAPAAAIPNRKLANSLGKGDFRRSVGALPKKLLSGSVHATPASPTRKLIRICLFFEANQDPIIINDWVPDVERFEFKKHKAFLYSNATPNVANGGNPTVYVRFSPHFGDFKTVEDSRVFGKTNISESGDTVIYREQHLVDGDCPGLKRLKTEVHMLSQSGSAEYPSFTPSPSARSRALKRKRVEMDS
ncbi:hypothetical protein R3P38DRAFT_3235311 [Favolaschia claudopus]|uniref:Uncharacterized protein n=1 Tax=Favolaschia claudopus TaxID=2862362 RepID=A0AAV9ZEJ7_9AGAR